MPEQNVALPGTVLMPSGRRILSYCVPARILAAVPAAVMLVLVVLLWEQIDASIERRLIYFSILATSWLILLRSQFFAVRLRGNCLVVSSWFRTYKVDVSSIRGTQPTQYSGMLNWGNIDGSGRWLWSLRIEIATGDEKIKVKPFEVTLTTTARAARLAGEVESLITATRGPSI